MHMADALLSPAVGGSMWAVTAGLIGYSSRKIRLEFQETKIGVLITQVPRPLLTKLAAMIAHAVDGAGIVMSDRNVAVSSSGVSAREILDKILKFTGGKGGGSIQAAQGRLNKEATFDEIRAYVKENSEGLK